MLTLTLNQTGGDVYQIAWSDVVNIIDGADGDVSVMIFHDGTEVWKMVVKNSFANLVERWEEYLTAVFTAQFPEADL